MATLPSRSTAFRSQPTGMLIVVALMVIVVLAGVGFIAVRGVVSEHSQVGLFRSSEAAGRITDTGLMSVLAMAVSRGDAFPAFVLANQNTIKLSDLPNATFDLTANGSFGRDLAGVGGVNVQTVLSQPVDTNRVPGYPVNDQFIWKRYRMITTGTYGDGSVDAGTPGTVLRNSQRSFVAYTYVGPYIVNGGGQ